MEDASRVCHPSLSHLRRADGKELLLVGTMPLDIDGASGTLVADALEAWQPDIVMMEGSAAVGVNAMLTSGGWEVDGQKGPRQFRNWAEMRVPEPELPAPRGRGWLGFLRKRRAPPRSRIPGKVANWAQHLHGAVGGDVAAAVRRAVVGDMPVRFLGPDKGGMHGHIQVVVLARRAMTELLEEERRQGKEMPDADINQALRRTETRMRDQTRRWLKDPRGETTRYREGLRRQGVARMLAQVSQQLEERAQTEAASIERGMHDNRRGVVLVPVELLTTLEAQLIRAGYIYVSECA